MSPPTSPPIVATTTTVARSSCPWLAATPAAATAVVPMNGTPAHDAVTAMNSSRYCHQVLATSTARTGVTGERYPAAPRDRGGSVAGGFWGRTRPAEAGA